MKELRVIWKYSEGYRIALMLLPLTVIADVCMEVLIPFLMSDILNQGIGGQKIDYILKTGISMASASVFLTLAGFAQSYCISVWSAGFTKNLRCALFEKVQALSSSDIDSFTSASLITRMSTDMNFIKKATGMTHSLIKCPILIISTIIMTFRISRRLSWLFIAVTPVFAAVIFVISKLSRKHYRKMFVNYDRMNTILEEDVTAIRTVKAFAREDYEYDHFSESAADVRKESLAAEQVTVLNNPILQFAVNICVLMLMLLGGKEIIGGGLLPGDLFCMITYTNDILFQVIIIALIIVPILSAQISMSRVTEVLDSKPSLSDASGDENLKMTDGSVKFENVNFGYIKDKLIIKDINVDIPSGSTLGIIGASGSAKTTLIQLIPRFYDVTSGRILVGGYDVHDYKADRLRSEIGIVSQKSTLFSGTVKDNLRWGKEDATDEEIVAACKAAAAHEFISAFQNGYDTMINQGGTNVSGGQRQRLCIARALIRKPRILILDDCLSAVDTVTDAMISRALSDSFKNTTIIKISQRITSIQSADQILVMDKGCISGIGTHTELLEHNRIYREIDESQRRSME